MKIYNSLDEVFKDCHPHQVTAAEILRERLYLSNVGWQDVEITPELRKEVIERIVKCAGGRETSKDAIRNRLRYKNFPYHWSLGRFLLEQYGDNPARLSYWPGQDWSYEMNDFRKFYRNM